MFQPFVTVPLDEFRAQSAAYGRVPALMDTAYKRNMTRLTRRYLTRLRVTPGKPPPGITRLMTPRQRRAFFASDGFGGGIPHTRTDAVPQGWKAEVETFSDGGAVSLYNDEPATYWAEWYGQQPFLAAVGWLYAPPILDEFAVEGTLIADATWYTVADPRSSQSVGAEYTP